MNIIITGFPAYSGEAVNPSQEVLSLLPSTVMGVNIIKVELPAVYHQCLKKSMEVVETHQPAAVLSLGMASGRSCIAIEKIAINWIDSPKSDNAGVCYEDTTIKEDGPAAYVTPFPAKATLKRLLQAGIPAEISFSAGAFISNHLMYGLLYLREKKDMHFLYGHLGLPLLPSQTVDRPHTPSMAARDAAAAVVATIEVLIGELRPHGKRESDSNIPSDR